MEGPSQSGPRRAVACLTLCTVIAVAAAGCGGQGSAGDDASTDGDGAPDAGSEAARPASASAAATQAFPEGWKVRTDRGDTTPEAVAFVATDEGYRVRPGPRAIYWNPGMRADGAYRVRATFRQLNQPGAPEAYGLFVGGRNLRSADQEYLYFLIRRDGEYLVKHRAGAEARTLVEWTEHEALASYGGEAPSPAQTLAVEAGDDAVRFLVDGTEVHRLERAAALNTDGQTGVRVNHRLEVSFTDMGVRPLEDAGSGGGR